MVNYWLAKQEPTSYSFSQLEKDKKTIWDGVHNNLALKNINKMKNGDLVFFYHSGSEKQIVLDLKTMDCVKDVYGTFGAYDILANLECDNMETLRQLIIWEVRKIKNIRSTVTLMGINGEC